MEFDPLTSFGPAVAARYDDSARGDEAETVECLAALAGEGPVLELAIGTGRIALPLAARGLRVDGIEQSKAMIARLRDKPGGGALEITRGDMASVTVERRYRLVYLVFNTLFNLLTQDDQVRCVANAARHLSDDGVFLVEAAVQGPTFPHDSQYVHAEALRADGVTLDVGRFDPVTQLLDECHVDLSAEGVHVTPFVTRYASPAEIDLMARLAGLRLHHRWGGWSREPFDAGSQRHISVYGR